MEREKGRSQKRSGKMYMKKEIIRCSGCEYCRELRRTGNTRSSFTCEHPDGDYIHKYFVSHKIRKMERFLDYGQRYSHEVPLKAAPAWCPKKAEPVLKKPDIESKNNSNRISQSKL